MNAGIPEALGGVAGKGAYPLLLAESAHLQGVRRVVAIAFRGETDRAIERRADEVRWLYLGQLQALLDALSGSGVRHAVMAGQITPTHLYTVRVDRRMVSLLAALPVRNAETIFGAVGRELSALGIELLPASTFMEAHMPAAGVLWARAPTASEQGDIALGLRVAQATSGLDIGQTVVIKQGTVLAVEAFEGTDAAILRAGSLGGSGAVVVKVAKDGHDMRFDIPVVGLHTMKVLRKAKASALAVQAGRCIMLDRQAVVQEADRIGLCLTAIASEIVHARSASPAAQDTAPSTAPVAGGGGG